MGIIYKNEIAILLYHMREGIGEQLKKGSEGSRKFFDYPIKGFART